MRKAVPFLIAASSALSCGGGGSISASNTVSLTLNAGPNGTLTANPPGPKYTPGVVVALTATANPQFIVSAWSGTDNDASTTSSNQVTMSGDRTVGVQFAGPTTCAPDPVTGNKVARMLSPANGATLPAGAVTFTWCNASADYFLAIESVAGAHDIFFAFAGGPGGAGVNTLTLGPDCASAPPTGCIPPRGESIFVTLYTLRQGNILAPSPFQYTFRAASAP